MIAVIVLALAMLVGAVVAIQRFASRAFNGDDSPVVTKVTQGCLATSAEGTAFLSPEQSKWAAIIVAESIRRDLPARAATIALATAMQESSLRNIDYGDRDSVGLFQQRPSQGWGTVEQIMDAWYSSGKFYEALVKVKDWQTGDINDVAQKVQRSGVPEGYRKHVPEAKVLASVLTGHTAAGLSCALREDATPGPNQSDPLLDKGLAGKVKVVKSPQKWTITAGSTTLAWASAHLMMAHARDAGIRGVGVHQGSAAQTWVMDPDAYAPWQGSPVPQPRTVQLNFS